MGGPNKIANFHLNTKKQKSWFWWPLSRKNTSKGCLNPTLMSSRPSRGALKRYQKIIENLSKNLSFSDLPKNWFLLYIYIYSILEQPGLTLEREARLIGEPIYYDYDKELERSLAINAKIGKNIYFAFGLTSASHYLDIGFAFILTSASHSFWHRLRRIVLTWLYPGSPTSQPASQTVNWPTSPNH